MGTTQRMARFIAEAKYEDIPPPAVNLAKLCLLDAVGCALYGTTRPLGRIMTGLIDELGGKPVSRVIGTRIETNAVNAAMANGTLGHSEDFDDSRRVIRRCSSCPLCSHWARSGVFRASRHCCPTSSASTSPPT
jgi:2-methylcitrate dehydratase PrpD